MNSNAKLIKEQNRLSNSNTSHILHFIVTLFTAGLWIPVWILVMISNAIERSTALKNIDKLTGEK